MDHLMLVRWSVDLERFYCIMNDLLVLLSIMNDMLVLLYIINSFHK